MHLDLTFTAWNRRAQHKKKMRRRRKLEKIKKADEDERRGVREKKKELNCRRLGKKNRLNQLNYCRAEIQLENKFNIKLQSPDTINYLLMTPI